jgi:nitrite reductase/ring-hydroxylating ferredoxin subunit
MGGEQKLTGPDRAAGIAVAELRDGEMLVGHARGEAVLLARRGEEIFAVGATCTHYSGPLGEGLFVDGTVRCPWHHACFDLRTGAPVRAPALNPVACYDVETKDGRVRVGARKPERPPPALDAQLPERIVIVGAGAAGHAAAEMLRREGYRGRLTMISADSAPPVDRPNLSKDYLAGNAPEEWIPLRPAEFFAEHDIELMLEARVRSLDTTQREVVHVDGRNQTYD